MPSSGAVRFTLLALLAASCRARPQDEAAARLDRRAASAESEADAPARPVLRNRLAQSKSPYLRSAAGQPVHWQEWGEEALALARELDRPILLDIGAVWCHWCHVIDRESYEDPEIAGLVNRHFVPVKVDRDERPDVDRRYQALIAALGRSGGWPLTGFLTPDGHLITGGTYFPPEDRDGRPGMKTILPRIAALWREDRDAVISRSQELFDHVARFERGRSRPGDLDPRILDRTDDAIRSAFDPEHAGFGRAEGPKFPLGSVLVYALLRSQVTGDQELRSMALRTIRAMANGGIRDQIGGAFHRYATDGAWTLPHFEVMSYVNAEMIEASAAAFRTSGDPLFRRVVDEAIAYVERVAADAKRGGFYASQDADVSLEDDGGYWTWTRGEVEAAASAEEAEVLVRYYDVVGEGEMARTPHGHPDRNVLRVAESEEAVAAALGKPVARVRDLLASGRRQLLEARSARPAPFVDRTLIASWNGMMIAAYLEAAEVFELEGARTFALRSLDHLLDRAYRKGKGMLHAVMDGEARVEGVLEDQVQVAYACVRAFEASGNRRYLEAAEDLARVVLDRYRDVEKGGFFDRPVDAAAPAVLAARTKPVEDSPTPSGNATAALLLGRLHLVTEKAIYRERERETLRAFAGSAGEYGLFAATYAAALQLHLRVPPKVLVIGRRADPATIALASEARRAMRPGKVVLVLDPKEAGTDPLPYPADPKGRPIAYVCAGQTCAPPTNDPATLRRLVESFGIAPESRGER